MRLQFLEQWRREGLISDTSYEKGRSGNAEQLFSLHWELRTILYLGVILLSGALGILVYKNIDTIGHQSILALLAAVSGGCFWYCRKRKLPFSWDKVPSSGSFSDYALLLGCLTFVTFIGYLQFQYQAFGSTYDMATFIPMIVLFFCAYYFDHLGVLSLGITNLATWAGIAITPARILQDNDFRETRLIYTGMLLGLLLIGMAWLSDKGKRKAHFDFTYNNFGVHMLCIAVLAAVFVFDSQFLLWVLILCIITWLIAYRAIQQRSFYFLLISILYAYVGVSYTIVRLADGRDVIYFYLLYFICSAFGIIRLLMYFNKKLKHDRV